MLPEPVETGHGVAVGDAEPPRPWRRRAEPPPRAAVPARNGSPSCSAPGVQQLVPGREHRLPVAGGARQRGADARRRRARAGPRRRARRISAGARRPRCGARGTSPISARPACRARGGRLHARWLVERRARTGAPRPSQLTKVPAFSATAATGSTTSARSVTALVPQLEATRRTARVEGVRAARRVGQVGRVDAADDQRGRARPSRRGLDDRGGVAAERGRAGRRRPRPRRPRPGPRRR